jgi:hypothetical protein
MKINKFLSLVLVLSVLSFFSVMTVSAAASANLSIAAPAASANLVGGAYSFNCSIDTGFEGENWTAAKIYVKSAALTANTSWALMASIANTTNINYISTINTTKLEDGNDYSFNCTLLNGTKNIDVVRSGLTINNGVPTTPTLSPATNTLVTSAGTQTFTGTVVDRETTSCAYVIGRGGTSTTSADTTSGTGNYSGTSCTFTKAFGTSTSPTADNGDWYYYVTASDESNTTASAQNVMQVQIASVGGSQALEEEQQQQIALTLEQEQQRNQTIVLVIIGIIVAAVVLYFIVRRISK